MKRRKAIALYLLSFMIGLAIVYILNLNGFIRYLGFDPVIALLLGYWIYVFIFSRFTDDPIFFNKELVQSKDNRLKLVLFFILSCLIIIGIIFL